MGENIKVDKGYLKAFNLGYELAKELNLKSPMFKELDSSKGRMQAMQAGMLQYNTEKANIKNKKLQFTDLESSRKSSRNIGNKKGKDKGKGLDFSI